jgi:hypothetical protein
MLSIELTERTFSLVAFDQIILGSSGIMPDHYRNGAICRGPVTLGIDFKKIKISRFQKKFKKKLRIFFFSMPTAKP